MNTNVSIHDRVSHRSYYYFLDSFADHLPCEILLVHKGGECKVHIPTFHSQGLVWCEDGSQSICQDADVQGSQGHCCLKKARLFL